VAHLLLAEGFFAVDPDIQSLNPLGCLTLFEDLVLASRTLKGRLADHISYGDSRIGKDLGG
jgi:hypothetical protein